MTTHNARRIQQKEIASSPSSNDTAVAVLFADFAQIVRREFEKLDRMVHAQRQNDDAGLRNRSIVEDLLRVKKLVTEIHKVAIELWPSTAQQGVIEYWGGRTEPWGCDCLGGRVVFPSGYPPSTKSPKTGRSGS